MGRDHAVGTQLAKVRDDVPQTRSLRNHGIGDTVHIGCSRGNPDTGLHERRPTIDDAIAVDQHAGDLDNAIVDGG